MGRINMKKIIIFISILTLLLTVEKTEAQVSIEIDRKIFLHEIQGMYYSKEKDAVLFTFLQNKNADELINSDTNDFGEDVRTGYIKGTKIFYIAEEEKRNDEIYSIYAFIKKVSDTQMISINTGFPMKDKEIYYQAIIDAVKSAKPN